MAELIQVERTETNVAVLTLSNGKVNALSSGVLNTLGEVVADLSTDLPGAVVVTGGPKIFAAGADISEFGGPDRAKEITARFHTSLNALADLPRLVIAAVNGYALGGGCELALACDYRIGSGRAVFGQPEILLGIVPGGGGTQRLPRVVGPSRAKEICLSGRQVPADEALRIGLLDELVEGDATERALELAGQLASGALTAQALIKQLIDGGMSTSLADGLTAEQDAFEAVFHTSDSQVGVASFREHGPGQATFSGH